MSRHRSLAWSLAGLALLLAVGTWTDHRDTERDRLRVLALLRTGSLDLLPAQVAEDLRRERDPVWRRLRLARTLVNAEMDPAFPHAGDFGRGPGDAPESLATSTPASGSLDRLTLARELAAEALAERPAVWQASMLLGAATYLHRSRARDPKLVTAYRDWETPLELALDLGPGKAEPGRFLAVAYLELWPVVSEEKRRTARALMTDAFRNPGIFQRLAGVWLTAVEDRREAFAPIPPEPEAWAHVGTLLGREGDWEGVREARLRYREALSRRREDDLEEAGRRLDGGDETEARRLFLRAATRGRPEPAAVPVLTRALARLPPGPPGRSAEAFREWLRWSLDLCLLDRCPLPPAVLDRVAGLAGELEPAEAALAELLTGDLAEAERLERRTDRRWHPEWSPYLLAKARVLLHRGEPAAAAGVLEDVHPTWRERVLYRWLVREVARAGGTPRDPPRDLPPIERERWPGSAWRTARDDAVDRLELWLPEPQGPGPHRGLRLQLAAVPDSGAVVEIRLDGEPVSTAVVRPGDVLPLPPPETSGPHLVELETLAGGRVLPGEVRRSDRPGSPDPRSSPGPETITESRGGPIRQGAEARSLRRPEEPLP